MSSAESHIVRPSIADQVAAVDAIAVAARVIASGTRSAMGASTVEILALAQAVMQLHLLAQLTVEMLVTADEAATTTDRAALGPLLETLRNQAEGIGNHLVSIGYAPLQQPTTEKEMSNGQG